MSKHAKILIISIVLLLLIPITYQGIKRYFRSKRASYSIGITNGVYSAGKGGSRNIYFYFYFQNEKEQCEDGYHSYYNAKTNNGRYFVRFDSLYPSNAVLLQDFPVPDSIKTAPPNGWKEIPIKKPAH